MSYIATESQKLNPIGTTAGNALIIYDSGISGQAKDAATIIAKDLQEKGYIVDLAGISSKESQNTLKYNIIVVGGLFMQERQVNLFNHI